MRSTTAEIILIRDAAKVLHDEIMVRRGITYFRDVLGRVHGASSALLEPQCTVLLVRETNSVPLACLNAAEHGQ